VAKRCQLRNCSLLNVIFQQCTECVDVAVRFSARSDEQESPAIADKPARRESLPKIATIRRADNTGLSSFV